MAELMTMRDIAGLAHVQRPVVTTWRRRSRASAHPFPTARQSRNGQELFLREDVVAWLEDTQRGNNPDVRAEAASHSLLTDGSTDAAAISALLVLRHLMGTPLAATTTDDLLDLADAHDPDDRCLFSELERTADLIQLAATADDLVEAAWGEASAHRRLMDGQLRTPGTNLALTALSEPTRRFLLGLSGPLTRELGRPTVMDPTGCAVDVLAELAGELESPLLLMDGDTPEHRLTRRQLLLADRSYRLVERGRGDWSVTGPVAHLVVLPAPADPSASALGQLDLLDEIALQLEAEQLVLCLAPASTLVDALDGPALARRDQLLRDGYVRAIVRLPAGFRPAQAREHSALWLLGSPDATPTAERRTMVADLGAASLRACEGLADDLVAAWQGVEGARRRAWAHLYPVLTRDLVSASSTLVPPRPARGGSASRSGADWAVELRAADKAGRLAGYRFEVIDRPAEEVSLAQAVGRGWVRVLPGRRVDLDGLPVGTVPVLDGTRSGTPLRSVDRLGLATRTDADLTEPGDIVFTVRPAPSASIDPDGGSLVVTPARVLRIRPNAPLVARAVVARINRATGTNWRAWTIATIPDPERTTLGEALTDLAEHRARLEAELAALDTLTADLTTAVESRQLSITKENHGASTH